ncbi:acyltransferase family protein [Arthrobacter sp. KNU40]
MGASDSATAERPALFRDRYFDFLRAIALIRIVTLHTFDTAVWLTVAFPSMGVMFALAGSLIARSLERPAASVLKSRARRLLFPLWAYSLTVVAALLLEGWRPEPGDSGWWLRLLLWVFPIIDPPFPGSAVTDAGFAVSAWPLAADILWYVRAYLLFVLFSPMILAAFRRWPLGTLFAPLCLAFVFGTGLVEVQGLAAPAVTDFVVFGSCWILGFAHYGGLLRKLSPRLKLSGGLLLMIVGLLWAATHLGDGGWDLGTIPFAQATWSFGSCVLLMGFSPSWNTLPKRLHKLDRPLILINNRAVTIYLWHSLALMAAVYVSNLLWDIPFLSNSAGWLLDSQISEYLAVWMVLLLLIPLVGWIEDIAAKRRPRLWPSGIKKAGRYA